MCCLGLNIVEIASESKMNWHCLTCYQCQEHCTSHSFECIDVSDIQNPVVLSSVPSNGRSKNFCIVDQIAYVNFTPEGIKIIDVSDPRNPVIISTVGRGNYWWGSPDVCDIAVVGQTAYLFLKYGNLKVVDVSNPQNPTTIDYHQFLGGGI